MSMVTETGKYLLLHREGRMSFSAMFLGISYEPVWCHDATTENSRRYFGQRIRNLIIDRIYD
jgi:hypothetical protein